MLSEEVQKQFSEVLQENVSENFLKIPSKTSVTEPYFSKARLKPEPLLQDYPTMVFFLRIFVTFFFRRTSG